MEKEITPEIKFKKEILKIFNDNSSVFQKSSSCIKNTYAYWYNCGYTSPKEIKNLINKKFIVEGSDINFNIINQPLNCNVRIVETFHTITIKFS